MCRVGSMLLVSFLFIEDGISRCDLIDMPCCLDNVDIVSCSVFPL